MSGEISTGNLLGAGRIWLELAGSLVHLSSRKCCLIRDLVNLSGILVISIGASDSFVFRQTFGSFQQILPT